ncbi:hypothetical protein FGB62_22g135 [Gracilaria domingensis]|nr:hypothetical protein FGB62_22g135 [Gracilaria domingensis]
MAARLRGVAGREKGGGGGGLRGGEGRGGCGEGERGKGREGIVRKRGGGGGGGTGGRWCGVHVAAVVGAASGTRLRAAADSSARCARRAQRAPTRHSPNLAPPRAACARCARARAPLAVARACARAARPMARAARAGAQRMARWRASRRRRRRRCGGSRARARLRRRGAGECLLVGARAPRRRAAAPPRRCAATLLILRVDVIQRDSTPNRQRRAVHARAASAPVSAARATCAGRGAGVGVEAGAARCCGSLSIYPTQRLQVRCWHWARRGARANSTRRGVESPPRIYAYLREMGGVFLKPRAANLAAAPQPTARAGRVHPTDMLSAADLARARARWRSAPRRCRALTQSALRKHDDIPSALLLRQ